LKIEGSPPKKRPAEIIYNGSPEKSPVRYGLTFDNKESSPRSENLKDFRQRLQKNISKEISKQAQIHRDTC
jgi:hypothetical protein